MKILVLVESLGVLSVLSKYDANEFYCGYIPEWWYKKYSKIQNGNDKICEFQ